MEKSKRSAPKKQATTSAAPRMGPVTTLRELRPDPKNARTHTPRNIEMLADSLRAVGAGRSIVIDEEGEILAGNGLCEAAAEAGITKVQVIDADGDTIIAVRRTGLTPAQKMKLAIYDNRTAELAEWDPSMLKTLMADGLDLKPFDFDADLLQDIMGVKPGLTDPDEVPAPRSTSIVVGDLFELGPHRLVCGDATDAGAVARAAGGQVDFVVTSPPYNVGMSYREFKDKQTRDHYLDFVQAVAVACVAVLRRGRFVAWNIGVSPKTFPAHQVVRLEGVGLDFYRQIVWAKSGVAYPVFPSTLKTKRARHYSPNYVHEVVQVFELGEAPDQILEDAWRQCPLCDGGGTVLARELPMSDTHEVVQLLTHGTPELGEAVQPDKRYPSDVWKISQSQSTVGLKTLGTKSTGLEHDGKRAHMVKEHPAPFPVELPRALMGFLTASGETVLDPFGGSGTTLIACEQVGRSARLVELDPVYCQIIIDRWEQFTGLKASKVGEAVLA